MKNTLLACTLLCVTTPALATQACLLEGTMKIGKETVSIKDCFQVNSSRFPKKDFIESCESMSSMGENVGTSKAKITMMATCPGGYQAYCKSMMGQPMSAYYYNRDNLSETKASCEMWSGTWVTK